jgi:O-succinylbenzoic acid--CoA ligase
VSLDAVERTVRSLPGLGDAVVVALPHPRWGETAGVVTAAVPGRAHPSLDEIRAVVGDAHGAAARPARLLEVDALPLLASGKPDRRAIRAQLQDQAPQERA